MAQLRIQQENSLKTRELNHVEEIDPPQFRRSFFAWLPSETKGSLVSRPTGQPSYTAPQKTFPDHDYSSALQRNDIFTFNIYKYFIHYFYYCHLGQSPLSEFVFPDKDTEFTKYVKATLLEIYQSKLPLHLLARCPLCSGKVEEQVDTFSLTGIGWLRESLGFGWLGYRPHDFQIPRSRVTRRVPTASYQTKCKHVQAVTYGVNLNGIQPDGVGIGARTFIGSERPGLLKPFMEQPGRAMRSSTPYR